MIFTNQKVCLCVASHKPSFLCKESPAEVILLVFVYKTASGIARSGKEVERSSLSAPSFIMGQKDIWDGEEHNIWFLNSWSAPHFIIEQNCHVLVPSSFQQLP